MDEWFHNEASCRNVIDIDEILRDALLDQINNSKPFDFDEGELSRLFAETDQDMIELDLDLNELSEQSDQNVLEGRMYSCSSCGMDFLSLENLQFHEDRCCNKKYNFKCVHCNRKFNRELYKNLHQQHCDRNDNVEARPFKQTKLDDFATNSINIVQSGGANEPHEETWAVPRMIVRALNNKAVTYRKEFDTENREDWFGRMEKILASFRDTINTELSKGKGIKYFFTVRMVFHQSKDTSILTDPPVSFRSEVFTALDVEKLDLHIKVAMQQFQHQIEEFQRNGSGWVIDHFINIDIGEFLT